MQTETLQITLPASVAQRLRERVQSGEFMDESSAISQSLTQTDELGEWADLPNDSMPYNHDSLSTDAFDRLVLPGRLAGWEAGQQKTYTVEEVRQYFANRVASRQSEAK